METFLIRFYKQLHLSISVSLRNPKTLLLNRTSHCWECVCLKKNTATLLCPLVALPYAFLGVGGPLSSNEPPKFWQQQHQQRCHTLLIKQWTLHFPLWKLLCILHDWLPPFVLGQPAAAMKNMPSGWFTAAASCVWITFHTGPYLTKKNTSTCWWNHETPSQKM